MATIAAPAHDYLLNEVMTATAPKLHLMLVEAAMRFVQRARHARDEARNEEAGELLIRGQEVLSQLVAGLNSDVEPELVRRMRGVYMFVYRCLLSAQLAWNDRSVAEAMEVLEVERETWRLLVQRLASEQADAPPHDALTLQGSVAPSARPLPVDAALPESGFSIEA